LADALASNMEKEKEEMFKNIRKRREDAEKRLQEVWVLYTQFISAELMMMILKLISV
jgi:hypothetical protein